jgi:hypothetical protein
MQRKYLQQYSEDTVAKKLWNSVSKIRGVESAYILFCPRCDGTSILNDLPTTTRLGDIDG